jgi:hypothetical protein
MAFDGSATIPPQAHDLQQDRRQLGSRQAREFVNEMWRVSVTQDASQKCRAISHSGELSR